MCREGEDKIDGSGCRKYHLNGEGQIQIQIRAVIKWVLSTVLYLYLSPLSVTMERGN